MRFEYSVLCTLRAQAARDFSYKYKLNMDAALRRRLQQQPRAATLQQLLPVWNVEGEENIPGPVS